MSIKMTDNFLVNSKQLREIQDTIHDNLDVIVRAVTEEVYSELTNDPRSMGASAGTPRDTRRATNGWNVSAGRSPDFTDPGPAARHSEPDDSFSATRGITRGTMDATVANGVPYITDLDDGTSQQAPAGFVRRAVNRAVNFLLDFDVLDKNFQRR